MPLPRRHPFIGSPTGRSPHVARGLGLGFWLLLASLWALHAQTPGSEAPAAAAAGGAAAVTATEPAEPAPNSNASCMECHSDPKLSMRKAGKKFPLFVEETVLTTSAHRSLDCIDCHEDFDGESTPHRKPMVPVDCFSCHEKTGKKHPFHARLSLQPMPVGEDTSCTACHGSHAVAEVKKPNFPFAAGSQHQACSKCHEEVGARFAASAHGTAVVRHAPNSPDCLACHRQASPRKDAPVTLEHKLAQTKLCESCHVDKADVADKSLRGNHFVESYEKSVHGLALAAGKADAATCVDCHGSHEMNRAMASDAKINRRHVAETCSSCHEKMAKEFNASVHASALEQGNLDSPTCTTCHGEHTILTHTNPLSPVHKENVAREVCATCHASLRLTEKYGLASHMFQTFSDSYHGLAVRGGAVEVVNCASCHSSHAIKAQDDPTSTVHKDNLVQTCGQCHPGANARFTVGKVHVSPEAKEGAGGNHPLLYLVSSLYTLLIVVCVGGMALHNVLDFTRKILRKLAIQKGLIEEEHVAHRLYLRMTGQERLQHGTLVISFVLLVVTGFMLRFPEAWWVVGIRNLNSHAFEWRSLIHRVAGVVLLLAGVWHVCYLAFTTAGRSLFRDLWPRRRDFTDPLAVLKFNLGLSPVKPAFPRFSYIEKAEYWALVWGTILMGVTGVILWFDNTSMGLFTKLGFDLSRTIHFYEAVLATLAIIVWHFYFVIFNPDVYPVNLAWLTGRMSEREMLEEHPLELARLKALEAEQEKAKLPAPPETPPEPPTKDSA